MRMALRTATVVILLGTSGAATAQITEFSPYSRNGLGLLGTTTSTGLLGAGFCSTAAAPSTFVNVDNPASIVGLTKTTLEVGGSATLQQLKLGEESASGNFGNTSPISLVVKRQGGKSAFNLGVSPYSIAGFAATRSYDAEGIGYVRETYDGEGGLSQFQVGLARSFQSGGWVMAGSRDSIEVQKHALFLGARLRYVFGQIQRTTKLDILDPTFLDNRTQTTDQHRSAGIEFGAQYEWLIRARYNAQQEFESSTSLRLGAVFSPSASLHTDHVRLVETTQTLGGIVTPLDTAFHEAQMNALGVIPERTAMGVALNRTLGNGQRWVLLFDWIQQDWGGVAADQTVALLSDGVTWDIAQSTRMGLEWTPSNPAQRSSAWGRTTYRVGAASGTLGMQVDEESLRYETLTAGFSIPMLGSRSASQFHFGTEFGKRSTGTTNSLQEQYVRFQFGFSLSPFMKNNWLVPRLYD